MCLKKEARRSPHFDTRCVVFVGTRKRVRKLEPVLTGKRIAWHAVSWMISGNLNIWKWPLKESSWWIHGRLALMGGLQQLKSSVKMHWITFHLFIDCYWFLSISFVVLSTVSKKFYGYIITSDQIKKYLNSISKTAFGCGVIAGLYGAWNMNL